MFRHVGFYIFLFFYIYILERDYSIPAAVPPPVQQWQCALPVSLSVRPEAGVAGPLSWHSGWHRTHTETGIGKGAQKASVGEI